MWYSLVFCGGTVCSDQYAVKGLSLVNSPEIQLMM